MNADQADKVGVVNSTIRLSFRYVESDYVHAVRAHYATRLRPRINIPVMVFLAAAGVCLWRSPEWRASAVFCLVAAGLLGLFLLAAFVIIPPLVFRRHPKFRDEYSLVFSPEGIHFRTVHIDSRLQWSMYQWVMVTAHAYVLYYGKLDFTVIPKRVFQDVEQQQSFEQLLTQQVPERVRVGK